MIHPSICSACREPRINRLPYCQQCGKRYRVWPRILGLVLVSSVIIWLVLWVGFRKPPSGQTLKEQSQYSRDSMPKNQPQAAGNRIQRVEALLKDPKGGDPALRQAITLLEEMLKTYPTYLYGLRLKASLHNLRRDHTAATLAYQTYLELEPNDAHARLALTQNWIKLGAYDLALEEGSLLYEQHPRFLGLLKSLETIHQLAGNPKKAVFYRNQWEQLKDMETLPPQPPRLYHPKDPTENAKVTTPASIENTD